MNFFNQREILKNEKVPGKNCPRFFWGPQSSEGGRSYSTCSISENSSIQLESPEQTILKNYNSNFKSILKDFFDTKNNVLAAISGPWGGGKSTIKNQLAAILKEPQDWWSDLTDLKNAGQIVTFEFFPWQYTSGQNIFHDFIEELQKEVFFALGAKPSSGVKWIKEMLSHFNPEVAEDEGAGAKRDFEKISWLLEKNDATLVILIDDIDRLEAADFRVLIRVLDLVKTLKRTACLCFMAAESLHEKQNYFERAALAKTFLLSNSIRQKDSSTYWAKFEEKKNEFGLKDHIWINLTSSIRSNHFWDGQTLLDTLVVFQYTYRDFERWVNTLLFLNKDVWEEMEVPDIVHLSLLQTLFPDVYQHCLDHKINLFMDVKTHPKENNSRLKLALAALPRFKAQSEGPKLANEERKVIDEIKLLPKDEERHVAPLIALLLKALFQSLENISFLEWKLEESLTARLFTSRNKGKAFCIDSLILWGYDTFPTWMPTAKDKTAIWKELENSELRETTPENVVNHFFGGFKPAPNGPFAPYNRGGSVFKGRMCLYLQKALGGAEGPQILQSLLNTSYLAMSLLREKSVVEDDAFGGMGISRSLAIALRKACADEYASRLFRNSVTSEFLKNLTVLFEFENQHSQTTYDYKDKSFFSTVFSSLAKELEDPFTVIDNEIFLAPQVNLTAAKERFDFIKNHPKFLESDLKKFSKIYIKSAKTLLNDPFTNHFNEVKDLTQFMRGSLFFCSYLADDLSIEKLIKFFFEEWKINKNDVDQNPKMEIFRNIREILGLPESPKNINGMTQILSNCLTIMEKDLTKYPDDEGSIKSNVKNLINKITTEIESSLVQTDPSSPSFKIEDYPSRAIAQAIFDFPRLIADFLKGLPS